VHEESWRVVADETGVTVTHPSGDSNSLPWEKIRGIFIETDDSGPFGADVWWIAAGDEGSVSFPLGATGEKEALAHFQTLPGFDNQALIKAMQSTDNATFVVWDKGG
jgi:hypothetical protein